jgi:HPt (histidine-containing phosphotransfer) domain-containing protein
MLQAHEIPFKIMGEQLHHGPVAGLAMCAWKPLFMTCGQLDKTVRVWNYETMTQELVKQYQDELFSAAMHPTGTAPVLLIPWTTHSSSHNHALIILSSCLPLHRTVCCDRLL